MSLSLLKEIHSGIYSKWKVHHISSAQTDLYLFTGGGECSLSAGEIIVRHKFLVLRRERQALLRIMLPIENSVGGYVRQIAVPHHHTTGSGFIHESVTHNNTEEEMRHGETRTRGREMNKCMLIVCFPKPIMTSSGVIFRPQHPKDVQFTVTEEERQTRKHSSFMSWNQRTINFFL